MVIGPQDMVFRMLSVETILLSKARSMVNNIFYVFREFIIQPRTVNGRHLTRKGCEPGGIEGWTWASHVFRYFRYNVIEGGMLHVHQSMSLRSPDKLRVRE